MYAFRSTRLSALLQEGEKKVETVQNSPSGKIWTVQFNRRNTNWPRFLLHSLWHKFRRGPWSKGGAVALSSTSASPRDQWMTRPQCESAERQLVTPQLMGAHRPHLESDCQEFKHLTWWRWFNSLPLASFPPFFPNLFSVTSLRLQAFQFHLLLSLTIIVIVLISRAHCFHSLSSFAW